MVSLTRQQKRRRVNDKLLIFNGVIDASLQLIIGLIPLTTAVAFAAAYTFGVRVERMSAFTFKLSVFFHKYLDADADKNHSHYHYCGNQDIKEHAHNHSAMMR